MSKHAISFKGVDKITRDSFAAECDINNIVDQYARTGLVNHIPRVEPHYGDAPDISFHEAACINAEIASAEESGVIDPETIGQRPEASEEVSEPDESPAPEEPAPVATVAESD